jgi:hypothetical protein
MSLQASPSATTRQVAPSLLRVKISLANFFGIESKEITFKDLKISNQLPETSNEYSITSIQYRVSSEQRLEPCAMCMWPLPSSVPLHSPWHP